MKKWLWIGLIVLLCIGSWAGLAIYRYSAATEASMRAAITMTRDCDRIYGSALGRASSCESHYRAHRAADAARQWDGYLFGLLGPLAVLLVVGGVTIVSRGKADA